MTVALAFAMPAPSQAADAVPPAGGSRTSIPGLYGEDAVLIAGGMGWATVISALPCDAVQETLTAGDWVELARFDLPQAAAVGADDRFLLLGRGDARAIARLRGIDGACNGSLSVLVARPFTAAGTRQIVGSSTTLPLTCVRLGDGQVTVDAFLDVAEGWLVRLGLTFVPVAGVRDLDPGALNGGSVSLARLDAPLFESLARDDLPAGVDLAAGPRFSGTIEVTTLDPLAAHVTLTGLANGAGKRQDLDAWIDCHVREGARGRPPSTIVAEPVALHLEVDDRTKITGSFGVTSRQTVIVDARLEPVVEGRYEGHATATASGTFTESDLSDFKGRCTGRWEGTQAVDLVGVETGTGLRLTVTTAGTPAVTFSKPCNADSHAADLSFPWSVLPGAGIDLVWPPGTPEADQQVVRVRVPRLGGQTWTITFAPAG